MTAAPMDFDDAPPITELPVVRGSVLLREGEEAVLVVSPDALVWPRFQVVAGWATCDDGNMGVHVLEVSHCGYAHLYGDMAGPLGLMGVLDLSGMPEWRPGRPPILVRLRAVSLAVPVRVWFSVAGHPNMEEKVRDPIRF